MEKNLRNGFTGKMEKRANGRPTMGGMAGERPAVGRGVVGL
jgi:hypothetical protein